MKNKTAALQIYFIMIVSPFIFYSPSSASERCVYSDLKEVRIETTVSTVSTVEVEYCGGDDGGRVFVGMLTGKNKQGYNFSIDNRAYSISIDSDIELKNGGGRGLGVANGRGRSGDGMWYWVFDQKKKLYQYIGEAPRLYRSKAKCGEIFSIESGSGDVQSVRYGHQVKNDRLILVSAMGFIPVDDVYEISLMTCTPDSRCDEVDRLKDVSPEKAQRYMNGTEDCDQERGPGN
ncbi:hypothetical protein [Burkholderia arboris]|uniref:hypothetical protein n=1 Tax=Burkholderia arboris TaxID=488730 RepID=UPI0012D92010|nr:hypothetical protein [Burkholderia arboris]MCA8492360.1 hypothetical protein [Burkholderia arboris]